jgi:hypothetical protein
VSIVTSERRERNLAVTLFFSLILTFSLFLQDAKNDNVVSRETLALSIVQEGKLSIDRYQEFTIDKAYFLGRFYSDKAPGMAILAIPAVAGAHFALKTLGRDGPVIEKGELTRYFSFYVYVSTLLTSGLVTAAAAAVLHLTARHLGATQVGALFGALSYSLATPAFGWATAFFGHATAGACLFLAFAAILALKRDTSGSRRLLALGCCAGGFLGVAIIVEFTVVPAAAVIALYGLRTAMDLARDKRWRVLGSAMVCGATMIIPLGLYNYLAFGSPLHLGYQSVVGFPEMKQGFVGLGAPKLDVLWQILFGQYRGLFTISPILLLSFWSTVDTWRKGLLGGGLFICIVAIATSFLLINSSYYFWDGGWSTGPRFLTPMIALLCLPLALQWSSVGRIFRGILIVSFMFSAAISLAATSVTMMVHAEFKSPLTEFIIPKFLSGDWSSAVLRVTRWPTWTATIPLIVIWALAAVIGKRFVRRPPLLAE